MAIWNDVFNELSELAEFKGDVSQSSELLDALTPILFSEEAAAQGNVWEKVGENARVYLSACIYLYNDDYPVPDVRGFDFQRAHDDVNLYVKILKREEDERREKDAMITAKAVGTTEPSEGAEKTEEPDGVDESDLILDRETYGLPGKGEVSLSYLCEGWEGLGNVDESAVVAILTAKNEVVVGKVGAINPNFVSVNTLIDDKPLRRVSKSGKNKVIRCHILPGDLTAKPSVVESTAEKPVPEVKATKPATKAEKVEKPRKVVEEQPIEQKPVKEETVVAKKPAETETPAKKEAQVVEKPVETEKSLAELDKAPPHEQFYSVIKHFRELVSQYDIAVELAKLDDVRALETLGSLKMLKSLVFLTTGASVDDLVLDAIVVRKRNSI